MKVSDHAGGTYEIRATDEYRSKYGNAMAEYLDTRAEYDEATGDVEWAEFVGRYGKRLVFTDDRGFVTCERYPTVAAARERFDVIDRAYGVWRDQDEDEDEDER